jgi:hypothetical protein
MNEQDLDRVIDSAAADLIGREPTYTLRHKVMARVRESELTAPRRFVWTTAGLAAAAGLVFALVMLERTPAPMVQNAAPVGPTIAERPTATVDRSVPELESAPQAALPVARRRVPLRLPPDDPSPIEAITTEPVVLPSIDLPPLENQAAFVEGLEIEALTIEPLTASND